MKILIGALAILLLGFSLPARADIDQHCLSVCKSSGVASSNCLAQCTYDLPQQVPGTKNPLATPQAQSGKVFTAPVPTDELVLPKPQKSSLPQPTKDYACVKQCQQNGGQYQLCNDRCTRADCDVGSTLCRDLRGVAPEQALPGLPPTNLNGLPLSTAAPGSGSLVH